MVSRYSVGMAEGYIVLKRKWLFWHKMTMDGNALFFRTYGEAEKAIEDDIARNSIF